MASAKSERIVLALLTGLVLLALGLGPVMNWTEQLMTERLLRQLRRVEELGGGRLEFAQLSAYPWGELRLRGLLLRTGTQPAAPVFLGVEELTVSWNPLLIPWVGLPDLKAEARGLTLHLEAQAIRSWGERLAQQSWAGAREAGRSNGHPGEQAGLPLPRQLLLHDLTVFTTGSGGTPDVQRIPLAALTSTGKQLLGVVELAGADGAPPSFLKLTGSRGTEDWQLALTSSEPLQPAWARKLLGRELRFDSLRFGPRRVELAGLTLSVPESQGTEIMARVAALALERHSGRSDWMLTLFRPEVQVELYPNGHHNLEDLEALLRGWNRGEPASAPTLRSFGNLAPIGPLAPVAISLRNSTISFVRYQQHGEPEHILWRGLQVELQPLGDQLGITALWVPAPEAGKVALEGELGPTGEFSLRIRPDRLELAEIGRNSSLKLFHGLASGDLLLAHQGEQVTLTGSLALQDASLQSGLLANNPLSGLNARMDLSLRYELATNKLELRSLAATLGEVELSAWGHTQRREVAWPYELTLAMGPVPCRDIPSSLPVGLIPLLDGLKLDGHATVRVRTQGDLHSPEGPLVDLDGTVDGFRVVQDAGPDLTALQRPFTRKAITSLGRPALLSVDPAVPGFTAYEQISPYLRRAVVSSEDAGFYRHQGLDFHQIEASLARDLKEWRVARGGSTLTQQVVKNLYLSREKTLSRKLQEAFLAWKLEQVIDKRRILEIYLNIIEWGPEQFGAKAASRYYFDKAPAALTLTEAVFLAAIIPNPVGFARQVRMGEVPEALQARMQRILARMKDLEYIDEGEYHRAAGRRPNLKRHPELQLVQEPLVARSNASAAAIREPTVIASP